MQPCRPSRVSEVFNRLSRSHPHSFFEFIGQLVMISFGLGLVFTSLAVAQSPELLQMQEKIKTNGWSWEADDTFINSLTPEARANLRGFAPPADYEEILARKMKILPVNKDDLPSMWDWRFMNGVTSVKNQGQCGSCWAFAAAAELESFIMIYYGHELNLSEQQIVSCNEYGAGCGGGWAGAAYSLFLTNGAIHEHCMPYLAMDPPQAPCVQEGHHPYGWVTGWHSIPNDVIQIKTALLTGPVCTGIDASSEFEMYGGGCYDVQGGAWTNHLVEIVGWDDRMCDNEGAWIIKNSWGTDFGANGFAFVKYGAGLVGVGVTQLEYAPPPVTVQVTGPLGDQDLLSETFTEITWSTAGSPVSSVDLWFTHDDMCFETLIAADVPNSGSYTWLVPNEASTTAHLLVFPHTGTEVGYGFSPTPLTIIGHKVRYVSPTGNNTPPFETPATAAHNIGDALLACTGLDSIMIAGGEYLDALTIGSTVRLFGGWNDDFTERNLELHETRIRGVSSAVSFFEGAGDFGGVDGITFHDCMGGYYSQPEFGRHGGAIYSLGASPTINNCVFLNCRAAPGGDYGLGGAIFVSGGNPVITNCRFEENVATNGGGIALVDVVSATFQGNVFLRNSCSDSLSANKGAALYTSNGQVVSDGDVFTNNGGTAEGGAIYLSNAVYDANNLTIIGGRAQGNGGAVYAENTDVDVRHAFISPNTAASSGGGLYTTAGTVTLTNVHLDGNQTTNVGGGAMIMSPTAGSVENCLVEGNGANTLGGGICITTSEPYTVRNNCVTDNIGGGLVCMGQAVTADYNDVWDNNGNDYGPGSPGPHDLAADPLWVDPAGGDYGLGLHSPCLDRGDPNPDNADPDGSRADMGLLGGPLAQMTAPSAIGGAEINDLGGGLFRLNWTPNSEPDMAQYVIYRDTTEVFSPHPDKVMTTLAHPTSSWEDVPPFPCYYLIVPVDSDGHVGGYSPRLSTSPATSVPDADLPTAFAIAGVVPNPFNPITAIWYDVPRLESISLRVYNLRGRLVRELVQGAVTPGRHSVIWDGKNVRGQTVAAGVYIVRLVTPDMIATTKVMLAK